MNKKPPSSPRAKAPAQASKKRWRPPTLTRHGRIVDVIRGGGGKLSLSVDGDGRKPGGSG